MRERVTSSNETRAVAPALFTTTSSCFHRSIAVLMISSGACSKRMSVARVAMPGCMAAVSSRATWRRPTPRTCAPASARDRRCPADPGTGSGDDDDAVMKGASVLVFHQGVFHLLFDWRLWPLPGTRT
jgi:hypothetical protein